MRQLNKVNEGEKYRCSFSQSQQREENHTQSSGIKQTAIVNTTELDQTIKSVLTVSFNPHRRENHNDNH